MKPKISQHTSLLLLTSGHTIHHIYPLVIPSLLPIFSLLYGLSYFEAGVLAAAVYLGMIMQLPVGFYSDRSGRRSMLVGLGLILTASLSALLGLGGNYLALVIIAFALGVAASTFHPPGTALVTEYFTREKRGRALGVHLMGGSLGSGIGPIIVGASAALMVWQHSLFLIAIPGIIIGIMYWRYISDLGAVNFNSNGPTSQITSMENLSVFKLSTVASSVAILIAAEIFGVTAVYGLQSFLPIYLTNEFNVDITFADLLLGAMQLSGIIGSPIGGYASDRFGRKPVIIMSLSMQPLLFYLFLNVQLGLAMYLSILLIGFFSYTLAPSVSAYLADQVPYSFRGRIYSFYFTATFFWMAVVPILTGRLADVIGLKSAFLSLIFLAALGALLSVFIRKSRGAC